MRGQILERDIQRQVIQYLTLLQNKGRLVFYRLYTGPKVVNHGRFRKVFIPNPAKGISDLVILPKNLPAIWAELKTPAGRLSDEQKNFQYKCHSMGHVAVVWRSLDDCVECLGELGIKIDEQQATLSGI